jgi:hypothetical protein
MNDFVKSAKVILVAFAIALVGWFILTNQSQPSKPEPTVDFAALTKVAEEEMLKDVADDLTQKSCEIDDYTVRYKMLFTNSSPRTATYYIDAGYFEGEVRVAYGSAVVRDVGPGASVRDEVVMFSDSPRSGGQCRLVSIERR